MICLGFDNASKQATISQHCQAHDVSHVVVLSPSRFRFEIDLAEQIQLEHVEWAEIISYKAFYRLLQTIGDRTLVVVNECLRQQNRHDLTYNCIRHFLQQAGHTIVFQYLPIIDGVDDAMILVDFASRSKWKRSRWRPEMRDELEVRCHQPPLVLRSIEVPTDAATRAAYARKKRALIDGIGLKDPHMIPRNLHLMGGKAKLAYVESASHYVGRNNRFKVPLFHTYHDREIPSCTVFEMPHRFIDFADFLATSRQHDVSILVSDLKVDRWYFERFRAWLGRVSDAYAAL